jgi:Holliday junction resolvase RusA-like endonuclease
MSLANAKTALAASSTSKRRSHSTRSYKPVVRITGRGGEKAPALRPIAQHGASYSYAMPVPPSLNNIYENKRGGGRRKSDDYKDWCERCDLELACQKPVYFNDRVDVSIYLPEPRRASDIDNRIKPLLDSLQRVGVIKNDNNKYVRSVRAAWSREVREARVNIYYAPAEAA